MNRANYYLPQTLQRKLKSQAKAENTTVSHLVRKFVEAGLDDAKANDDWAERFIKIADMKPKGSGPVGAAKNHDYYLYGPGRIE